MKSTNVWVLLNKHDDCTGEFEKIRYVSGFSIIYYDVSSHLNDFFGGKIMAQKLIMKISTISQGFFVFFANF